MSIIKPIINSTVNPLVPLSGGGGVSITPIDELFTASVVGDYWQPSNFSTLWTTSGRSVQVTTTSQNVGYCDGLRTQGTNVDVLVGTSSKRVMTVTEGGYRGIYGPGNADHLESNAFTAQTLPVIYGTQFYTSASSSTHIQVFNFSRATPSRAMGLSDSLSAAPWLDVTIQDNGVYSYSTELSASTFYYLLSTWDGTEKKIYLDGELILTASAASAGDNTLIAFCGYDNASVNVYRCVLTKGLTMFEDPTTPGLVESLNAWLATYSES